MSRLSALLLVFLTLRYGSCSRRRRRSTAVFADASPIRPALPFPQPRSASTNIATGFTRDAQSNDEGYFVIPNLPIGTYTVTIKKEGFETQRRPGVVARCGNRGASSTRLLKVGAVSTTVEVTGGAPVIEPSRVSTGRTISQMEVDNLPLTSRNPYNFVLFQPGVSGHPNPELGVPRVVNTNGLDNRVQYQMDGMVDTESDQYGLRLFAISDSYVREVQTVSNSFAPEFGRTTGDIYNAITNSGTNQFHGEFYFIGRPPGWSANPILLAANQTNPGIDLHDYSMNAGGPIKKDKVFVFGAYEHLLRGTPQPVTITARQRRCHRASRFAAGDRRDRAARAVPGSPRGLEHQLQEPVLRALQLFPQRVSVQYQRRRIERAGRGFGLPRSRAHRRLPTADHVFADRAERAARVRAVSQRASRSRSDRRARARTS